MTDGFISIKKINHYLSIDIKDFLLLKTIWSNLFASLFLVTQVIFFSKLDFDSDQIYFKDIALDFLNENGFEPALVKSEKEAKSFDIKKNYKKYPIYFFKSDTSGEKTFEEFYTEDEDYNLDKYHSLGYIKTKKDNISFDEVLNDFDKVFSNLNSNKEDIIKVIKKYVPTFNHIETGKYLDQKM